MMKLEIFIKLNMKQEVICFTVKEHAERLILPFGVS